MREALGNSLNIPAVKTLKFVGADAFMDRLHRLGIDSLTQNPSFYAMVSRSATGDFAVRDGTGLHGVGTRRPLRGRSQHWRMMKPAHGPMSLSLRRR